MKLRRLRGWERAEIERNERKLRESCQLLLVEHCSLVFRLVIGYCLFSNPREIRLSWATLEQKRVVEELKKDPAHDDQRRRGRDVPLVVRRTTNIGEAETYRWSCA
ncbi:hypothetical protein Q3G72_027285 [Acer saccharum]|nr:hypothetical protein Q3G72_027285 [Acer saccharum]